MKALLVSVIALMIGGCVEAGGADDRQGWVEKTYRTGRLDYAALRAHGFSDEDIWDIGGIAAFFALSNRMADVIGMRPNDEFYLLGRMPKSK